MDAATAERPPATRSRLRVSQALRKGEPQAHPKAAYQLSHPGIGPGVALHRGGR